MYYGCLCFSTNYDYQFSDGSLQALTKKLTLLPIEDNPRKRDTLVLGTCLKHVSFESFYNLLKVASSRVNLDFENL